MGQPTQIAKPTQLLVEGNDYRNFFEAFADHLGLSDSLQIQNFGGVRELRTFLTAFVKMPDFGTVRSIGIVRDAEEAEAEAFQSVRSSLGNANAKLPIPTEPGMPSAGSPMVTVLILPGGGEPGMLETLLCRTFVDQEVDRCIDKFFECARALPNVSIHKPDKARAHTYLTTTKNPHHSVGVAAKAGVWDLDHAAFGGVRAFLASVCEVCEAPQS